MRLKASPPSPPPLLVTVPSRLLKVSGRLLQATSNHFRRPDQGQARGRGSDAHPIPRSPTVPHPSLGAGLGGNQQGRGEEAPPSTPHANGNTVGLEGTAAAAAGTMNGSGSGDEGGMPPRNLGKLLAQLSSSTRLDFANRYLEVQGLNAMFNCMLNSWNNVVGCATIMFAGGAPSDYVYFPERRSAGEHQPIRSIPAQLETFPPRVSLQVVHSPPPLTPTIPQEFRSLSASWDSTKHLSMGKVVLHSSLSGLLRKLAHDESAKQVRSCYK